MEWGMGMGGELGKKVVMALDCVWGFWYSVSNSNCSYAGGLGTCPFLCWGGSGPHLSG